MTGKPRRNDDLDQIDRRILSALQEDGRLTTNALADKVGLSPSPCWTRVKRLEESGVIEKYVAVLDHKVLGFNNVVFVEITLDKHDDRVLDQFGEALTRAPEVVEAYLVTGEYDYLAKVIVSGTDHYERFLRETLYRIPGIRQTRTTFGLRALKRSISVDPLKMP
ncbi:Lrp/AsnC family transcriptional regulator [Bosea lathyri]|uniref:Transcriptional regulator, AsnC family n=1 Tax=Bosea lathyri TaxID=1036778 RepID=A0A1H5RYE5_9HYPH|nr:Lrp/AsnC family transcriptional regulator [Bosea lathyri]SEF42541.1 transcriptional regulator, AsnC family [Bosea lathyri]